MGDNYNTTIWVRRLHDLWKMGESSVQPRWRSKGGVGSLHLGINFASRLSFNSNDGNIVNCNNRLWNVENTNEPTKLWELGKQLWMSCCGDEDEVIKEFE